MKRIKNCWIRFLGYFKEKSGEKTVANLKKVLLGFGTVIIGIAICLALFGKSEDHTHYTQNRISSNESNSKNTSDSVPTSRFVNQLFQNGEKQKEIEAKKVADQNKKKGNIKYFASQILGSSGKKSSTIKSGSKLIGFLLNPVDTRSSSLVRVRLPKGGEQSGISIEPDSILLGHFNYSGSGNAVYFNFFRVDSPDGESKKITASGLDAATYTAGITGEEFTGSGVKVAASIGLNMFAGMADTLTERQSFGNSFNGVQAQPTMRNALLQGMTGAARDQAGKVDSTISEEKTYVIVPEGKEMIIELTEDFGR